MRAWTTREGVAHLWMRRRMSRGGCASRWAKKSMRNTNGGAAPNRAWERSCEPQRCRAPRPTGEAASSARTDDQQRRMSAGIEQRRCCAAATDDRFDGHLDRLPHLGGQTFHMLVAARLERFRGRGGVAAPPRHRREERRMPRGDQMQLVSAPGDVRDGPQCCMPR